MPVQISVGPPTLTINQGTTFMVTDLDGAIVPDSELGLFASDTRFVSFYAIYANGQRWNRLSSSATTYYAARIHLANPDFPTEAGQVPECTLGLTINRNVADGVH